MSKILMNDEFFMRRALDLAKKGKERVSPNPMVGAVLVKNGKIIAEGYHHFYGGPHAEVNVLKKVTGSQIKGAVLYVTLEPCCHFGKTPPCTNFLISRGIKHIVVAMRDPNPKVAGEGISQLKKAGVKIQTGVLEHEALRLNRVFVKNKLKDLPFVSIKLGLSLDGKITGKKIQPGNITNDKSRIEVHMMRKSVDAILTTSETVLKDNPHLGVRLVKGKDPLRVIIDSNLRTDLKSKVYRDNNVIVATTLKSSLLKRNAFEKKKIKLLVYKGSKVPLDKLLKDLYRMKIYHLMTEAGAKLVSSLVNQKLADELILIFAPKIIGNGLSWIRDPNEVSLKDVEVKKIDSDLLFKGALIYS